MAEGAGTGQTAPGAGTRPALTRFLWPAVMLVVGAGAIALAWYAIYPQPEIQITVPAPPSLVIYTNNAPGAITYALTTDPTGQPEMQITVTVGSYVSISGLVTGLPVPTQGQSLEVTLPPPLTFRNCDQGCHMDGDEWAWVKPLNFDPSSKQATDVFPIYGAELPELGMNVGGVYAYAAIPGVSLMTVSSLQNQAAGSKVLLPTLSTEYQIPTANSYDWSSGPVPTSAGSTATWQEVLTSADTPGQTASGVDHHLQKHDVNFTFWAGVIIGLAGSVVLAGLQLLLPSTSGSGTSRKDTDESSAPRTDAGESAQDSASAGQQADQEPG